MKIVDAFCFFNELDLLEVRLETLNPVVDYFVLVEANKTQSLKDKPYYFEENRTRYAKFLHKIIHVKVDDCPASNDGHIWRMENFQRNCIKRGLAQLQLDGRDLVLISDLDEIPNPRAIEMTSKMEDIHALAFAMEFFCYYFNVWSPGKGWVGTVMARREILDHVEPQELRNIKDHAPRVVNAGWHFSWLGGVDKIREKLLSCIEPFDKSTVPSKEELEKRFADRVRDGGQFNLVLSEDNSVPLALVKENELVYPEFLSTHKEKFKHLFV